MFLSIQLGSVRKVLNSIINAPPTHKIVFLYQHADQETLLKMLNAEVKMYNCFFLSFLDDFGSEKKSANTVLQRDAAFCN